MSLTAIHGVMHSGKSETLCKFYDGCKKDRVAMLPQKVMDSGVSAIEVFGRGAQISGVFSIAAYAHTQASKRTAFFIDEAQFADASEIATILRLAFCDGADVTVSLIEKDYLGREFPVWKALKAVMEITDKNNINVDTATSHACENCGKHEATENALFVGGKMATSQVGDGVFHLETDDAPLYKSLCEKCAAELRAADEKQKYDGIRRKDGDEIRAFAKTHTQDEIAKKFFNGKSGSCRMWLKNNGVSFVSKLQSKTV